MTVECDDRRQDVRYLLRRVELAGLLARARGELTDKVLVSITEGVAICGELREPLGDRGDDCAKLRVPVRVRFAKLVRAKIDLREKTGERTLE